MAEKSEAPLDLADSAMGEVEDVDENGKTSEIVGINVNKKIGGHCACLTGVFTRVNRSLLFGNLTHE